MDVLDAGVASIEILERRVLMAADLPFGGRTRATFVDADGGAIVVTLKGPGAGAVSFATDGNADASLITLNGTTAASSLTVAGDTRVSGLQVNGALKSITGKTLDLAGAVTITGTLAKLQIRDLENSIMTVGGTTSVGVKANNIIESSITVAGPIKSFAVANWSDADATPDVLAAASIGSIKASGFWTAGISTDSISKMAVTGPIVRSFIRTGGSIGSIVASDLNNSQVFAGIRSDLSALPTVTTDFANPLASIKSVTLKSRNPGAFRASLVTAPTIGKVAIGPIASFSGGFELGVVADRITSFSASTNLRGDFKLSRLDAPRTAIAEDDFVLRIL